MPKSAALTLYLLSIAFLQIVAVTPILTDALFSHINALDQVAMKSFRPAAFSAF